MDVTFPGESAEYSSFMFPRDPEDDSPGPVRERETAKLPLAEALYNRDYLAETPEGAQRPMARSSSTARGIRVRTRGTLALSSRSGTCSI